MKKLLFVVLVFGTVFFTSCENDVMLEENVSNIEANKLAKEIDKVADNIDDGAAFAVAQGN